jgi:nanoRNase/pAp phosphatase (c-di-AMP/oligoRNAs hydrolase)
MLVRLGFDERMLTKEFDDSAEIIILLDVNNFDDCGAFKEKLDSCKSKILIIDHHLSQGKAKENILVFNDESYNSAASIVYEALKSTGFKLSKETAELLALGIISDSAEFKNASAQTFSELGDLLRIANMNYTSLLPIIQRIASAEARRDSIIDLFNSRLTIIAGLLCISGRARDHANQSADNAIRIGADITLFHAMNNEISFSARMRPPLDKELGLHLGELMKRHAPIINGHGGGHPCAAGAYGTDFTKADEFIKAFISEVTAAVAKRYPKGYLNK